MSSISRLQFCPMRLRLAMLRQLGWTIGEGSEVACSVFSPANRVTMGRGCYVGAFSFLDCHGGVFIHDRVRIGAYSKFLTRTHSIAQAPVRRIIGDDIDLPITVGYGTWIGANVTVLPGVEIAPGCVIAAGAVVTRSTSPNHLYAGVPARAVKPLPITPEG